MSQWQAPAMRSVQIPRPLKDSGQNSSMSLGSVIKARGQGCGADAAKRSL